MGDICFEKLLKESYENISASSLAASMFVLFANCTFIVDLENAEIRARESSTTYLGS